MGRHNIWKKFDDAELITLINYSNLKDLSKMQMREKEANEKKKMILNGQTSKKYLVGLTTFYSLPTPVVPKYDFSDVKGARKFLSPIIDRIDQMEANRILNYPFSTSATLVFVQKDSFTEFTKQISSAENKKYKRLIFWPAVSRKRGALNSGQDLLKMLENECD